MKNYLSWLFDRSQSHFFVFETKIRTYTPTLQNSHTWIVLSLKNCRIFFCCRNFHRFLITEAEIGKICAGMGQLRRS